VCAVVRVREQTHQNRRQRASHTWLAFRVGAGYFRHEALKSRASFAPPETRTERESLHEEVNTSTRRLL